MKLSNKAYDILKCFTITILPALGTLYFTLSQIYNISYGEEVVGTIAAISTFIGGIIKASSYNYNPQESDINE